MRLRWLSVVAGLGLGLSSCSFDDGGVQPDGNDTPPDASVDAVPPVCTPGCEGDILVTCPEGGAQRVECDLGCVADATPHCAVMVPSNGVSADDLDVVPADKPFVVPDGETYVIDTDTGRIVDGDNRQIRPATAAGGLHVDTGTYYARRGETVGVFAIDALTVEPGATLRGEGERALIVLARGDILVRGTIDVSAGCVDGLAASTCGGPGGGEGASVTSQAGGCAPGGNGAGSPAPDEAGVESGAGGGGFGAAGAGGGRGGTAGMPRAGGAGGAIATCSGPTLVPLVGGSGGGAGGVGDVNGGAGGGGGGALQLTSLTRVTVDAGDGDAPAILRASGAGGTGPSSGAQGGGGGGSGGALLLEAPTIVLADGSVAVANGGGGGSGTVASSNEAANGAAGGIGTARASGGIGEAAENNRGFGGVGGARSGGAGTGGNTFDGGGGGGGGVGIIRINRRTLTIGGSAVVSPEHSEGALNVQ
jgi:hypothetical protein